MKSLLLLTITFSVLAIHIVSQVTDPCKMAYNEFYKELSVYQQSFNTGNSIDAFLSVHKISTLWLFFTETCFIENQKDFLPNTTCLTAASTLADFATKQNSSYFVVEDPKSIAGAMNFIKQKCLDKDIHKPGTPSIPFSVTFGGGSTCAGCTVVIQALDNYIKVHQVDITTFITKTLCSWMPPEFEVTCMAVVGWLGHFVIDGLTKKQNADRICLDIGLCVDKACHMLPPKNQQYNKYFLPKQNSLKLEWTPWDWIIAWISKFTDKHLPIVDFDGDAFSIYSKFRGYDWRGRDCNEFNSKIYPGRKTFDGSDKGTDYDCNGIKGIEKASNKPFKDLLCKDSGQLGTVVLGDSVGAHFSIPPKYMNSSEWGPTTFLDIYSVLSDELDLPHKSGVTGHVEASITSSIYKAMVDRNRCNRNDYQNVAVNGVSSRNVKIDHLARDKTNDYPILLIMEMVGNDVCGTRHDVGHWTDPTEFKNHMIDTLTKLNNKLPKGSHIFIWGLIQGWELYNSLCVEDRAIHPLNITYDLVYDFLNCLESNPCWGWLNSNETLRNMTQAHANKLNAKWREIEKEYKFDNFDYQVYEIPVHLLKERTKREGLKPSALAEPVDGFHGSQLFHHYVAEWVVETLEKEHSDWLGPINPHNEVIDNLFPGNY